MDKRVYRPLALTGQKTIKLVPLLPGGDEP